MKKSNNISLVKHVMLSIKTIFLFLIISIPLIAFSQLNVPHFFSDGMVLQRNKPIKIWGWSNANAEVELRFKNQAIQSKADANGRWMATFPPMKVSNASQTLSISSGNTTIEIKDILIGDVWLCSGQSNMEWYIHRLPYAQAEKNEAHFPKIRMFTVEKGLSYQQEEDIPGGAWRSAEGENVLNFSATAYFFGRYLHQELNIPIGLITSAWGGTNVEAWTPSESWENFPDIKQAFLDQSTALKSIDLQARKEEVTELLNKTIYTGIGFSENWQNPKTDLSTWSSITIPQKKDNELFASMDGAVWFRKSFEIPLPFRGKDLKANLGQINDHDIVWINGHKIGESKNRSDWRNYIINKEYLKEGLNEIVIRIFDYEADGGYVTNPYYINIHPVGDKMGYYLLSGDWKYKIGKTLNTPLELPNIPTNEGQLANITPSALYNRMIHPLRDLAISGAIWYQGETNSSRGYEYQYLFPNMIEGWRNAFNQGDFPFLFVQLPNFHGKNRDGILSNWPELRQAQAAALQLANTGMTVTIDIGEDKNIHPANKQDVGRRLALAALNIHYANNEPYQGPSLQQVKTKKNALILTFEHYGEGLESGQEEEDCSRQINNFEVAGVDNTFHKAYARIVGKNKVKVWSEQIVQPVHVRYAWENAPSSVNFFNSHGLPAPPFRTDDWKWQTKDNKYINQIR